MNKKGISPLIAAVLLIAFTVAIATIIMGWMSTTTRDTTQDITNQLGTATACADASVSIQNVIEIGTTGNYTIVVTNSGYENFTSVAGTIAFDNGTTCTASAITLNTGSVGVLTATSCGSGATAAGDIASVIVNTNCGGVTDSITGTDTTYFEITA